VAEHRDIKFGVQVDHSKSQPTDDKQSLKEVWSHHVTQFNIFSPSKISLKWLKLEMSNFVHWFAMRSISLQIGYVTSLNVGN